MANWVSSSPRPAWESRRSYEVIGYDKSAQPVQVLPRVVTKVSQPVISVSITVCKSNAILISAR